MEELLKEIQNQIEKDNRSPQQIYEMLKGLGMFMFTTNTISKDNVVAFCSSLLSLYIKLKGI